MIPEKIKKEFRIGFVIFALIILISYYLILGQSPFFDSIEARIYFVLLTTSMIVFASLLENYIGWNNKRPEKLKERFKQITFLLSVPFLFLVLTNWGYTFFLILLMGIPLGLSIAEGIPIFHYIKPTAKKVLLAFAVFALLYFTAKTFYSIKLLDKETVYVFLISYMVSSILANFFYVIKRARKSFNKKKRQ
ncbi:MAG: hypothetical protein ABH850_01245 [Candidatus Micrarchaeota archaeon]